LDRKNKKVIDAAAAEAALDPPRPRKKKAKGPNPLSVKKKKAPVLQPPSLKRKLEMNANNVVDSKRVKSL
jgi:hypothetical protein